MSDTNSIEKRMLGSVISAAERDFIDDMRHHAACGVGYGFMQQVTEWEWQDKDDHSWGPEFYNKERVAASAEIGQKQEIINRAFDVYTDEADPDERARKMWDILGEDVSENPAADGLSGCSVHGQSSRDDICDECRALNPAADRQEKK